MRLTKILGHMTILLALASPAWAERPAWCQPGYVCLETKVAEQREREILSLRKDLIRANARPSRWFGRYVSAGLTYQSDATTGGYAEGGVYLGPVHLGAGVADYGDGAFGYASAGFTKTF